MTTITFDALKFVETLKESGFDEPQAKGMAVAIQEVQKSNLEELATKADIQGVKHDIQDVRREIKELEVDIRGELRLIKWMLALVIAVTVLPALRTLFGL